MFYSDSVSTGGAFPVWNDCEKHKVFCSGATPVQELETQARLGSATAVNLPALVERKKLHPRWLAPFPLLRPSVGSPRSQKCSTPAQMGDGNCLDSFCAISEFNWASLASQQVTCLTTV
ncbi:hypothetical protein KEM54_004338, partial [Ascosphaera aggregata]